MDEYTVTWIVDGKAETETHLWGAVPSHPVPVRPADPVYSYTFAGWSPAIVPVSGDIVKSRSFGSGFFHREAALPIDRKGGGGRAPPEAGRCSRFLL